MKKISLSVLITVFSLTVFAQNDMDLLTDGAKKTHEPVIATFKGTRLVNFHTIENPGKRSLDFRISHRFGAFNGGAYNAFGLDGGASIRLGLEYSFDGRFAFGIGRTSAEKMLDGFLKYRLLKQTTDNYFPLSITIFTGAYHTRQKDSRFDSYSGLARNSYCSQIIIGRKFSERFSLQIAPTYVHYNLVDSANDKNNAFVIAAATRYKVSKRTAITAEYAYRLINNFKAQKYYDTFSVGIDIETGGHVFQIQLTNSFGIVENQFLLKTTDSWKTMGIRLGFNISRVFRI